MLTALGAEWRSKVELVLEKLQLKFSDRNPVRPFQTGVEAETMAALCRYLDLLVEWNGRVDLTAARNNDELVDLTVCDALVLAACSDSGKRWVDVGSGAGAPGLILSLLRPDLDLTLVEPRQKRAAFLRASTGLFAVDRIRVERVRVEDLGGGGWDVAVSRATFAPDAWLARGAALAGEAVWVLLARGEAPRLAGWARDLEVEYEWPLVGVARRAVRYVHEGSI